MDMATTELQKSLQLFDKKLSYYQTPNIDSKEDLPFTFRSSNAQKSTSEKEPESEPRKAYHKKGNGSLGTNQAFNLNWNNNDSSRSNLQSGVFASKRGSQAGSELVDQKKNNDQYNRLLDFSHQELFEPSAKGSLRNLQIDEQQAQKQQSNRSINGVSGYFGNGHNRQHTRTRSLENGHQIDPIRSFQGDGGGGGGKHKKEKSDKFDMMMIVDVVNEEDNILNNPFDKDFESQGNLFNQPPIIQSSQQSGQVQLINFSRNSSIISSVHNRNYSGSESQSTKPQNDINTKNKAQKGGVYSFGFETDEVESTDKSIDDKIHHNTQKSAQHQRRIKQLNLSELKTINEQSNPHTEDRSMLESWGTKNSIQESRKIVSNYLFNDREPLYQTRFSKCYIASKNQNLVLVKMIDRKKITANTQEKMRIQFKQLIKKMNENKADENHSQANASHNGSVTEQESQLKPVVNILDYFQTKAYIYIIYEYIHQQSLLKILQTAPRQKLDDKKSIYVIEQILNSLEELQTFNTVFQNHGNLKLENVFWDGNNNIKLSDFCPTYQLAKQDISNYDKSKFPTQYSDTKQLGLIYLSLLCGINALNHTNTQNDLQNFLKGETFPRQINDILINSIFSETASLSDFRRFINKNQQRLQKKLPQTGSLISSNRNSQLTPTYLKSSFLKSPQRPSILQVPGNRNSDERQSIIGSFLENTPQVANASNVGPEQKSKTKETTFLKKYGYTQCNNSFDLKITHLKVTKHKIGDDFISNEQEFETNYSIPIFTNTADEASLRKKKNLAQLNYNPKYQWQFINELDNLPYFERETKNIEENNYNTQYLLDGYYKLINQRFQLMRCRDKKTKKNFIIKCINIEDDQEFNEVLREIAISKYIEHNIQPGIIVDKTDDGDKSEIYQQTKVEFGQQSVDANSLAPDTQQMAMNYLENLYREADKEVKKQFQGGIQKFVDSYIVQRIGNEFTFFLIFEEVQFSLKDFILKNAINHEENPDKEEIIQSQIFNMISVITKQIKALKRIGIVHNNIQPENILFQNCSSGRKRIILANFSQALIRKPEQNQDEFSAVFMKLPNECYKYKSPEIRKMMEVCMQEKEQVSFDPIKSDVFSLGLCAIELKFNSIIKDSQIVAIIESIQPDTTDGDLILYMIHFSASIRFSEKEVLQYLKEETQIEKSQPSIASSPLIVRRDSKIQVRSPVQRKEKKSFTQILSVQSLHRIQENNMVQLMRSNSKKNTITTLTRMPSITTLQKEQPEFKLLNVEAGNEAVCKKDLFQYTEMSLSNYGEVMGGIQILYQAKCSRMLYLFNTTQQMIDSLEQKFFRVKQKFPDQMKLEYQIFQEIANFRRDVYDYKGSVEYCKRVLSLQSKYFVDDIYTAGRHQLNIAILDQEKNNSQIIYYLRSALDNFKEYLGNSSPKLVKVLTLLGDEYAQKGQVVDALHQYQECMIITNYLGYQGPLGIRLLDKLGWAFFQTSDYISSLKFFQKSTQIKEKVLLDKDISLAETYNNLAECFRVLNDQNKAIFYYEQSLNIILDLIEENEKDPDEAQGEFLLKLKSQVYNNLGLMYKQINKYEKAIKLFNESYSLKCQLFGTNSIEVQECLYNVAVIYDDQNQHTQAMQIYDQIIQQFKVTKDLDNLVYADCLHNKGICYYNINDFTKGLNLLNESLSIKRKKINNSVSLAVTLQNLGLLYHKLGQYKKSLQLYEEALKIFVKKLKPDHPYIFIIQENMKQTQRFAK